MATTNKQWVALIHELAQNTVKIYFSTHVLAQMARRAISMQMALETLRKDSLFDLRKLTKRLATSSVGWSIFAPA